jgi:hypothetical protein
MLLQLLQLDRQQDATLRDGVRAGAMFSVDLPAPFCPITE